LIAPARSARSARLCLAALLVEPIRQENLNDPVARPRHLGNGPAVFGQADRSVRTALHQPIPLKPLHDLGRGCAGDSDVNSEIGRRASSFAWIMSLINSTSLQRPAESLLRVESRH
jgi:hypothetical protein